MDLPHSCGPGMAIQLNFGTLRAENSRHG